MKLTLCQSITVPLFCKQHFRTLTTRYEFQLKRNSIVLSICIQKRTHKYTRALRSRRPTEKCRDFPQIAFSRISIAKNRSTNVVASVKSELLKHIPHTASKSKYSENRSTMRMESYKNHFSFNLIKSLQNNRTTKIQTVRCIERFSRLQRCRSNNGPYLFRFS